MACQLCNPSNEIYKFECLAPHFRYKLTNTFEKLVKWFTKNLFVYIFYVWAIFFKCHLKSSTLNS